MNSLNSLILEGKLLEPTIIENDGEKVLRFFIEVERFYRKANEDVRETSRFICEGFGVFTEEKFMRNMIQDRGIRIVGRLKQYKTEVPYTCIVCEHIEFKPIIKK